MAAVRNAVVALVVVPSVALNECTSSSECDSQSFCPEGNNPFMLPAGICAPRRKDNSDCWGFDVCLPGSECKYFRNHAVCNPVPDRSSNCTVSTDCDEESFCPTANNPFMLPAGKCAPRRKEGSDCWGFDACLPGSECKYFGNHGVCNPVPDQSSDCTASTECDEKSFCPTANNPFMLPALKCAPRRKDGNDCWGFDACLPGSECKYFGNHGVCHPLPDQSSDCTASNECDEVSFCPTANNPFMLPAKKCAPRRKDGSDCWGFDACLPGSECKYFRNHAVCNPASDQSSMMV